VRPRSPDSGVPGTRPRVLVVDDDDATCDLLRELLSEEGYAVATVPHGAAALELAKHHQPAIIILDLRMPIMDGWSFVEHYRRQARPPAPLILLSAMKDAEENAKRIGAAAFVRKPFDLDELLRVVEGCFAAT
jgi:CheY-like chemotaxis protein